MTASRSLLFVCQFLALYGALSQSVKSCGGPNDHLTNVVNKLTPDPIAKGSPFTIEMAGDLDADIGDFNANIDLNVTALGLIHASVTGGFPLSISPAAPKGSFKVNIGPISLPSSIPGSAVVQGQVHVVNAKNEPVLCLDMNLNVPAMGTQLAEAAPEAITSCGKTTDHIPDFSIATAAGVTTMTGTLDEAVTKASVDLDVTLKVLILSIPLKMTIPLDVSAGLINKGAIKSTIGPNTVVVKPAVTAKLTGTMKINDGNGEEITCLNVDTVIAGDNRIVV